MALSPGLESLAVLYGVEVRYHDVDGVLHEAGEEALRELLGRLGAPLGAATVEAAARHRRVELARRALTRVVVAWQPEPVAVLALREATARGEVRVSVATAGGESRALTLDVAGLERIRRTDVEGESSVELAIPLPSWVGVGYHRLQVEAPGDAVDLPLWVAPARAPAPPPRGLGLFAPLAAVRSARSDGIGDFRDLEAFGALVAAHGGDTVATLPLLPTFLDGPFDPSPYSPVSRLFWNELHLAIDQLPELALSAEARALLVDPAYRATAGELRAGRHVDPLGVLTHKRRILALLSDAACRDPASRERFEAELRARPDVAEYARFRSRMEQERRPFRAWPARSGREAAEGAAFRYHAYCQLRAESQLGAAAASLRAAGVGLYLDLPLGAHPDGYDAYRYGEELLDGAEAGAPPDALFEGGQGWGFAPLHPERSSRAEHRYFRASVRHAVRHAARLRVDHVMGLHRIYTIPRGFGAKEGIYVRMPADELWAALLIEASLRGTSLVGEDLGTVPDEVRARMARHGVARLFVSEFEAPPPDGSPLAVPEGAVASPNTHDMPTFPGWLRGRDLELRAELGLLLGEALGHAHAARREERHRLEAWLERRGQLEVPASDGAVLGGVLAELAASRAELVVVGLDDLVGEIEPQNVPGTGPERPNFRRKIAATLEDLGGSPEFHALMARLARGEEAPPLPRAPRSRPAERLTDLDLYLLSEGTHRALHDRLGAHPGELDGVAGTYFAVWAPDASRVSVVGDFVGWRPDEAPLFARPTGGVWEGFVPGVRAGDLYKFHVVSRDGHGVDKADPFARRAEVAPRTASIVWAPSHEFRDAEWMETRSARNRIDAPWSIYELHLGSFQRGEEGRLLGYRELAPLVADHVARLGFTHVELMPVMEHPYYGSWGYQVTGYFAASSRYGTPEDLMAFVDHLHQRGIGVVFDWVPGHFPTDAHGLSRFDGTALYEHEDPRLGFHPDWRSLIFNYGRHEVRAFLTSSALHWLDRFHGDGLRVDGVASMLYLDYSRAAGEWIPNRYGGRENLDAIEFLRWLNQSIYETFPDTLPIAEESTAWPMVSRPTYLGGLGFGAKWDLGWMHDTLDYFRRDPIHRRYHHDRLTFRTMYAWHENFVLPLSHDEVVHGKGSLLGKMPGDRWQRFASLRLLYALQWASPGHKLLFMGGEFGTPDEWSHERPLELELLREPAHAGIAGTIAALNGLYRETPALHELDHRPEGFAWVDADDAEQSVLAFERRARDGARVLCVFNFTPVPRYRHRIGVADGGMWPEIFNSNAAEFGGTGEGNYGAVRAEPVPAHGREFSLALTLPPLAAVFFRSPR